MKKLALCFMLLCMLFFAAGCPQDSGPSSGREEEPVIDMGDDGDSGDYVVDEDTGDDEE